MMPQCGDSALEVAESSFVQIKRFNLSAAWDTAIARVARLLMRLERSQHHACNPHHRRLYGRRINRASSPVRPTPMVKTRSGHARNVSSDRHFQAAVCRNPARIYSVGHSTAARNWILPRTRSAARSCRHKYARGVSAIQWKNGFCIV
jgi:hypothetical protein